MFSVVGWIIFSFIGLNMALASACILQRSLKRASEAGGE